MEAHQKKAPPLATQDLGCQPRKKRPPRPRHGKKKEDSHRARLSKTKKRKKRIARDCQSKRTMTSTRPPATPKEVQFTNGKNRPRGERKKKAHPQGLLGGRSATFHEKFPRTNVNAGKKALSTKEGGEQERLRSSTIFHPRGRFYLSRKEK